MIRFGRKRHVHKVIKSKPEYEEGLNDTFIEECSCGKRRISRVGWGRESGTYNSRWFDVEEINKLRRLFPEEFKKISF